MKKRQVACQLPCIDYTTCFGGSQCLICSCNENVKLSPFFSFKTKPFIIIYRKSLCKHGKTPCDCRFLLADRRALRFYRPVLFSRLFLTNCKNSGCGRLGRDLNSGWNCTPMNQRLSGTSKISHNLPSGDLPTKYMPASSSLSR